MNERIPNYFISDRICAKIGLLQKTAIFRHRGITYVSYT